MARKSSPTISQEELYPAVDEALRPDLDDSRLVDLDREEESPFLRAQKRVSVRRGALPKKAANGLKWAGLAVVVALLASLAAGAIYRYGEQSWRFRVDSSDDIEISGNHSVSHAQVLEAFGSDIGRNIFFIPLSQRRAQLEQIPWVESASVMRFVPNRLKVEIHERTPVAFVRLGSRIALIGADGTVMDLPLPAQRKKYSFPVILGANPGEPLSTRAARMRIYNELVRELDSGGAHYSQDLSEVDLGDPDDVKVVANDPQGAVLVHLGSSNFLGRYKVYVSHLQEWRQQFEKVESVDLRYDRQIIINPDLHGLKETPLSASAARVATAAGVRPAALVTKVANPTRPKIGPAAPWKRVAPHAAKKLSQWQKKRRTMARMTSPKPVKMASSGASSSAKPAPARRSNAAPAIQIYGGKAGRKPSPVIAKEQKTP